MRNNSYDIVNKVLRKVKRNGEVVIYYFDKNGIYKCIPIKDALKMNLPDLYQEINGSIYWDSGNLFSQDIFFGKNISLLRTAICKLKEGDRIESFYKAILEVPNVKVKVFKELERFITKIGKPVFIREPENHDRHTFDFIFIETNIITQWKEDRMKYIQDNKYEITKMVIDRLKNYRGFQKYGVPISFLKISKITLKSNQNFIQFVFELKKF